VPEPLISVLLPTRNGVELLGDCVRGVLSQDGDDFELIVADNANDDGTAELLESFSSDERLTVVRQEQPVSVVENWNLALRASSGRYVLVIGDDDLLLPWYMERARALLDRFEMPDCLSYNGYRYAFPGFARSGETGSHYADPFFTPHPWLPREGILDISLRHRVLSDFGRFVMPLTLNMQVTLVARKALDRLAHPEFRAPFPDFYALLALLAAAESWAISDEQLIAIGVSANSFSQSLSGETDAKRGMSYLGVKTDFPGALPGNDLFNGIHVCLEQVKSDYAATVPGFEIDRAQYLLSQLLWWYAQLRLGALPPRGLAARLRRLRLRDWWLIARTLPSRLSRLGSWLRLDKSDPTPRMFPNMQSLPEVADITEFAGWVSERRVAQERM
jgi:glycosyltransferase involved in cell wall biosynthesis